MTCLERLFKAEGFFFVLFFVFSQSRKENLRKAFLFMLLKQDLDSSYYSDYVKSLLKKRSSNCRSVSDFLLNNTIKSPKTGLTLSET